jgi:hypothetical protein
MKAFIFLIFALFAFGADFERNDASQSVFDKKRGLLWDDSLPTATQKLSYKNAYAYCGELNTNGATGWRLPNATELVGIIDTTRTPSINAAFRHAATGGYWCEDNKKSTSVLYWVDFSDSTLYSGSGVDRYLFVRCVKNK